MLAPTYVLMITKAYDETSFQMLNQLLSPVPWVKQGGIYARLAALQFGEPHMSTEDLR